MTQKALIIKITFTGTRPLPIPVLRHFSPKWVETRHHISKSPTKELRIFSPMMAAKIQKISLPTAGCAFPLCLPLCRDAVLCTDPDHRAVGVDGGGLGRLVERAALRTEIIGIIIVGLTALIASHFAHNATRPFISLPV